MRLEYIGSSTTPLVPAGPVTAILGSAYSGRVGTPNSRFSSLVADVVNDHAGLLEFFTKYEQQAPRSIADFVAGNPQEMPLAGFVAALAKWLPPTSKDHFAYKQSTPEAVKAVADALARDRGLRVAHDDVFMTNGAFPALALAMRVLADAGDEIIYNSPPWFFYRGMIKYISAVPVRVDVTPGTWDLDIAAIERAITAKTRAIIVNSPNNPSGRLYPRENLDALARVLHAASERYGRRIHLISDESYSRILFDGRRYVSPVDSYPHSLLVYTYGKQLLTPGERMGYIALPPAMPLADREVLRNQIVMSQILLGWLFPNAVLQYAAADLEPLSIDIAALQKKRDRVATALRDAGYYLNVPEGTFYVLVRSPWGTPGEFVDHLAAKGVLVLPGSTFEMPEFFRISITASLSMIEKSLPVFAAAIKQPARV
jgi:aspartate aminotransferase